MGAGVDPSRRKAREIRAALRLKEHPGLGDQGIRTLIRERGSAVRALRALGQGELWEAGGPATGSGGPGEWEGRGIRVEVMTEEGYPEVLLELTDPPPVLFLKGRRELLLPPAVAVVGSRKATEVGRRMARDLGRVLAGAGVPVVSGLARGIDGAAHRGALEGGGDTVAVLGCGLDVIYPRSNGKLFRQVEEKGLLVSEFLPSQEARPHHFPKRNRIIAALARGVVVVEADQRSGALITVDHALDLGREILAVPGSVENSRARGTNALLRDGARVLTHPEAILDEVGPWLERSGAPGAAGRSTLPAGPALSPELRSLWDALGTEPLEVDEMARRLDLPPARVLAGLSNLELEGWASRCPGMRYRRCSRG